MHARKRKCHRSILSQGRGSWNTDLFHPLSATASEQLSQKIRFCFFFLVRLVLSLLLLCLQKFFFTAAELLLHHVFGHFHPLDIFTEFVQFIQHSLHLLLFTVRLLLRYLRLYVNSGRAGLSPRELVVQDGYQNTQTKPKHSLPENSSLPVRSCGNHHVALCF